MTDPTKPFFERASASTPKERRNPFELGLPLFGILAFGGGIILSAVGAARYASDSRVSGYVNAMSGDSYDAPDAWGLQLATFGNQLSTVGVVVLIGMAFYAMTRWNAAHRAAGE